MSDELKACPFCGAMPDKLRTGYMCSTLGCALQENTVSEKEWNTRPLEDALLARAERAEAIVERMIEAGKKLSIIALLNTREDKETWERWHALVAEWRGHAS